MGETVAELGELALIERLKPYCAAGSVGDDAALMTVAPGFELVVTTDVLIDTVHFSDRTTPPHAAGWRAIAANLSDLAAMGAAPLGITVGLGLPPETTWNWVEALYQGMAACLAAHGGAIVGGDVCRSSQRTLAITAMGQVRAAQSIRRDTAACGMAVVVTGPHGRSRAGLALLLEEAPLPEAGPDTETIESWIRAHQYPRPRFDAIASLQQLGALNKPATVSGMDSSDGLANALLQISQASGVGMAIARSQVPLPEGLADTVGEDKAIAWALYGGEDFELVLCMPQAIADRFTQTSLATQIGITTGTPGVRLVNSHNQVVEVLSDQSFQHFQKI